MKTMHLAALQKTTLIDFPGKIAALVFTQGCNFRCPYCHNPELVSGTGQTALDEQELFDFLKQRTGRLQGIVISGGEPTLHTDLPDFCSRLKRLGIAIKLDTNGSRPEMLRTLLTRQLVDYIAMDIKTAPAQYQPPWFPAETETAVLESLAIMRQSDLPHEFRVTCAAPFVTPAYFSELLEFVGAAPVYLQTVRLNRVLSPSFFCTEGRVLTAEEVTSLQQAAVTKGCHCSIR